MASDSERDKRDYHDLFWVDLEGRPRHLTTKKPTELVAIPDSSTTLRRSTINVLHLIPEEQVWLDGLKTANTRRAYQNDVIHFATVLRISSSEERYAADHRAVTYWEKHLREVDGLEPSTIRRRLSALSSLFKYLVDYGVVKLNPVREIKRPKLDRSEGKTLAFSRQEARRILDKPHPNTLLGLRDRAIQSVGFQTGFRREEIANLRVDSLHKNRGLDALWVKRKRKRNRQSVTINPLTASRIREYLDTAGHSKHSSRYGSRGKCARGASGCCFRTVPLRSAYGILFFDIVSKNRTRARKTPPGTHCTA